MKYKCTNCSKEIEVQKVRTIIKDGEVKTDIKDCDCGSGKWVSVEESGPYNIKLDKRIGRTENYY